MNSSLSKVSVAVALLSLFGCTPPRNQQEAVVREELSRRFGNLNRDAELRKLDLKTPRGGAYAPVSLGRQFSDFIWHPDLVIVVDIQCAKCKGRQTIPDYRPGSNSRILCPRCGAGDDKAKDKVPPLLEGKLTLEQLQRKAGEKNVLPMFEKVDGGPRDAFKAKVRYLRRQWTYDASGRVETSGKGGEVGELLTPSPYDGSAYVDMDGRPTAPSLKRDEDLHPTMNNYYYGGYHRLDAQWIGEMEVEYDGGLKVDAEHEEPLRPWAPRFQPPPSTMK